MGGPTTLEEIVSLPSTEIRHLFDSGEAPDPLSLVNYEFRGYNLPFITRLIGIQKFRKGFYRHGKEVWGYNIPIIQGKLASPWDCKPSNAAPARFGFYRVSEIRARSAPLREDRALYLDYSRGKNSLFQGSMLRDYLRAVRGSDHLLLGRAYLSLFGMQLFPSLFVLQRDRPAPTPVEHGGR